VSASAAIRSVPRAALLLIVVAGLLAGCGDATSPPATATSAARKAACTRPALLQALRGLGNASPVIVQMLRCGSGYAFTRVREGKRQSVILWQDAAGRWEQIARDKPSACPQQAAAQSLCKVPPPDPALRRCTSKAFLEALRDDVDQVQFRIGQIRCRGGYARTRFTIVDCPPGQAAGAYGCSRTRVAAWRRDTERWKLITYSAALDCNVVQAAAPKFPAALCD
jgi:hypothetical protein